MAAFSYSTLMGKCPSKIESVACWTPGPDITAANSPWELSPGMVIVFVGTSEGTMLVYELDGSAAGESFRLRTTKRKAAGAKRAITDLQVSDRWKLVFQLAERRLNAHILSTPDLSPHDLQLPIEIQHEVHALALNPSEGLLCLGLKDTIHVLEWADRSFIPFTKVPLMQSPRSLSFTSPRALCVGYGRSYAMLGIDLGQQVGQAIGSGWKKSPTMSTVRGRFRTQPSFDWIGGLSRVCHSDPHWTGSAEVVVVQDNKGFIVNEHSEQSRHERTEEVVDGIRIGNCLNFNAEAPTAIIGCQPYVVSLLSRRIVIHSTLSCRVVQTVSVASQPLFVCATMNEDSNGILSYWIQKLASFAAARSDQSTQVTGENLLQQVEVLASTLLARVFVATETSIHVLTMSPLASQVSGLKKSNNNIEALTICAAVLQHPWLFSSWPIPLALGVQSTRRQALHFASDLRRRIALDLIRTGKVVQARQLLDIASNEGHLPLPDVVAWFRNSPFFVDENDTDDLLDKIRTTCVEFTTLHGMSPNDTCFKLLRGTGWVGGGSSTDGASEPAEVPLGVGREGGVQLGTSVTHALLPLAWKCRAIVLQVLGGTKTLKERQEVFDGSEILEVLDSILLCAYMLQDVFESTDNKGDVESDAEYQQDSSNSEWETGQHKLEFLISFNRCKVEQAERLVLKFPEAWETLLWLYYSKGMHGKALTWLKGLSGASQAPAGSRPSLYAIKTVEYLSNLDGVEHVDLILEHSKWVLEFYSELGLEAFYRRNTDVFKLMCKDKKRPKVLRNVDPETVLRHLDVLDRAKMSHQAARGKLIGKPLALCYLEHEVFEQGNTKAALQDKLALMYLETIMYIRASNAKSNGNEQLESVVEMRTQLQQFIESAENIDAVKVAKSFASTDMQMEYALLLKRSGNVARAVAVFIHQIGSLDMAVQFCEQIVQDDPKSDVFHHLVHNCIELLHNNKKLPNGELVTTDKIANLLQEYSEYFDATKLLLILPVHRMTIAQLAPFVTSTLGRLAAKKCTAQVKLQLLKKESLRLMKEKTRLEQAHVVVVRDRTCSSKSCNRRFKADTALVRYPNGDLMHYSCYERECTKV